VPVVAPASEQLDLGFAMLCTRYRSPIARHIAGLLVLVQLSCRLSLSGAAKIDDEPELAVDQVRQEAILEVQYARMKEKYGLGYRRTLQVFFQLFDLWIMLYRLNKADKALAEVLPACEWRRDDWSIKAVQALAFTRWKQGRHREALERFHEMEGWMGKNAALSENIGHTYNAIGSYDDAELSFGEALRMTQHLPVGTDHNMGGILLGLAGVQERRGNHKDALQTAKQAYEFYKKRDDERGWDTSLSAKALMQVSKIYVKFGRWKEAEAGATEAARIFEVTAGADSPLMVGALERLGLALEKQDRLPEARAALHRAYKVAGLKDALDLLEVLQLHNQLVDTHLRSADGLDRSAFPQYFEAAGRVASRVKQEMKQDGNAGAYYKAAGELYVLGGSCAAGRPLLSDAVALFRDETSIDTSGLIRQCTDLIAFCDGTLSGRAGADGEL